MKALVSTMQTLILVMLLALLVLAACNDNEGGLSFEDDDDIDDDDDDDDDDQSPPDTEPPGLGDVTVLEDTRDTQGPYVVEAVAWDDIALKEVNLYYALNAAQWKYLSMWPVTADIFHGEIPGQPIDTEIWYFVEALDFGENSTFLPDPEEPYTFRILPPPPDEELFYDDNGMDGQVGCTGSSSDYCVFATRFSLPDADPWILKRVKFMISNGGGIPIGNTCTILLFDVLPSGQPASSPQMSQSATITGHNQWLDVLLDVPMPVQDDFAVGLAQTAEFLSIGIDRNNYSQRQWISMDSGTTWRHFDTGEEAQFRGEFMLRAVVGKPK